MNMIPQFLGPFVVVMILTMISLGLVIVLRSGTGEPDRRGGLSSIASFFGLLGMFSIPIIGGILVWGMWTQSLQGGNVASNSGVLVGFLTGLIIMGRSALFPRKY